MGLFSRKKKVQEPVSAFKIVGSNQLPLVPFGTNIYKSDVVKVCIDRVASHCSKLKMRYVKDLGNGNQAEKNFTITYCILLKNKKILAIFLSFVYKASFPKKKFNLPQKGVEP